MKHSLSSVSLFFIKVHKVIIPTVLKRLQCSVELVLGCTTAKWWLSKLLIWLENILIFLAPQVYWATLFPWTGCESIQWKQTVPGWGLALWVTVVLSQTAVSAIWKVRILDQFLSFFHEYFCMSHRDLVIILGSCPKTYNWWCFYWSV